MTVNRASLDPRIGMLIRAGQPLYYAFVNGYGAGAIEGSLGAIEQALGLPITAPSIEPEDYPFGHPKEATELATGEPLRSYVVTCVPRVIAYAGTSTYATHTETSEARSAAKAIKEVRRLLREENGRHGVTYTISARLVRD